MKKFTKNYKEKRRNKIQENECVTEEMQEKAKSFIMQNIKNPSTLENMTQEEQYDMVLNHFNIKRNVKEKKKRSLNK